VKQGGESTKGFGSDVRTRVRISSEKEGDTIIATQLPERTWTSDAARSRGVSTFACNFGFQQAWGSGDPFIDSIYEDAYIVQGSNTIDPIDVIIGQTNLPEENVLEEAARKTVEDRTPFEHFPGTSSAGAVKDPYAVWRRNY